MNRLGVLAFVILGLLAADCGPAPTADEDRHRPGTGSALTPEPSTLVQKNGYSFLLPARSWDEREENATSLRAAREVTGNSDLRDLQTVILEIEGTRFSSAVPVTQAKVAIDELVRRNLLIRTASGEIRHRLVSLEEGPAEVDAFECYKAKILLEDRGAPADLGTLYKLDLEAYVCLNRPGDLGVLMRYSTRYRDGLTPVDLTKEAGEFFSSLRFMD